jgi:hypothetical protein
MDTLWIYKFMYFEHNFMNIDAVILMPDTNGIEISREKNLTIDNMVKLKVSFEVQTYYPAFRKDRIDMPGYSKGTGQSDMNGYSIDGGFSDYFNQPGSTQSSYYNQDDYFLQPKRTRWFNNILRAREQSNSRNDNPRSRGIQKWNTNNDL